MKQSLQTAIIMHIIYLCSIFEHSAVLFLRFFLNSVFKTKLKMKKNKQMQWKQTALQLHKTVKINILDSIARNKTQQ